MAENCWGDAEPIWAVALAGEIVNETNVAAVTVSVVEPLTDPEAAVMSDEPGVFDVARPELFTVATPVVPEVQITAFVRSTVEPSL
jgi:hypothetical protein